MGTGNSCGTGGNGVRCDAVRFDHTLSYTTGCHRVVEGATMTGKAGLLSGKGYIENPLPLLRQRDNKYKITHTRAVTAWLPLRSPPWPMKGTTYQLKPTACKTWKHSRTWGCFGISEVKGARRIEQRIEQCIELKAASSEISAGKMFGYGRVFGASPSS